MIGKASGQTLPIFEMELNKVYNENCLETMQKMPNRFIDICVTSPPYNMNLRIRNGKYCSRQIVKEISTKYEDFQDNLPISDFYSLHYKILSELIRVSKIVFYNIQIVTGSKRAFFKLIGDFNENLKDIIIWDKINAQPAMQTGVLNSQHELILIFGDNAISRQFTKFNFKRGELSNTWPIKKASRITDTHGAVYPEKLVKDILVNFSNEGDIVYDPFSGTGTTFIVSALMNRKFIGSEISKPYCDLANKRYIKQVCGL